MYSNDRRVVERLDVRTTVHDRFMALFAAPESKPQPAPKPVVVSTRPGSRLVRAQ